MSETTGNGIRGWNHRDQVDVWCCRNELWLVLSAMYSFEADPRLGLKFIKFSPRILWNLQLAINYSNNRHNLSPLALVYNYNKRNIFFREQAWFYYYQRLLLHFIRWNRQFKRTEVCWWIVLIFRCCVFNTIWFLIDVKYFLFRLQNSALKFFMDF